jgi:PAS domain S-box-containing protein
LKDSEGRYRVLYESSVDGIALTDLSGRILDANQAYADMVGYSRSELKKLTYQQLTPEKWRKNEAQIVEKYVIGGRGYTDEYEKELIKKNGTIIPVSIRAWRIENRQGKPDQVWAIVKDTTKRKQMEQEIRDLARFPSENPNPILRLDAHGTVISANEASKELLLSWSCGIGQVAPKYWRDLVTEVLSTAQSKNIDVEINARQYTFLIKPILEAGYVNLYGRDITARKKAEDALRESEEKYRAIVENSPNLIGIFQDGVLKYVNNAAALKLGWTVEEAMTSSFDPIGKIVSQKSRTLLKENIGKRLRGEDVTPYEIGLTRKDGSELPVLVRAAKIIYKQKPAIEFVFHDITERKQIEDALRKSEERFREAMEATNDGMWDWNVETDEIYFNPAYNRMLGYEPDYLSEDVQSWKERIHPDDRDRVVRVNEDCIENRIPRFEVEFRIKTKSDEWIWVLGRGKATSRDANGRALRMIGTHVDITTRKRLELEVVQSRQYLHSVISDADVWLDVLDHEGNVQIWNKAAERISGYSREEVVGDGRIWEWLYPDEPYRREVKAKAIIEQGKIEENFQTRIRCKDGQIRTISWNSRNLLDDHQHSIGSIAIGQDVTERNRLEEELRQYSEHLEQLVNERTREIHLARERLEHVVTYNPAAIFVSKPRPDLSDFDPVYVSENVVSLLGFDESSLLGLEGYKLWITRIHPEDHVRYLEEMPLLWKNGHNIFRYRFLHKDGAYRWIREEVKVIHDSSGSPVEVIGCWTDSTERMRLEEEIKRLNDKMTLRLTEVTDQVELLSRSRNRLKAAPDVTSGLDIILDSVLWGFGLDSGAVLLLDRKENRVNVRASKGREKELRLDDSYPLGDFVELKDLQTTSVTKVVGEGERSIFGAATVLVVPILAGKEVYGLLVFGSVKPELLDSSSMRILELYSELVYSFMIEKSITVVPARELTRAGSFAGDLQPGQLCLITKDPTKAFAIFVSTVFGDHEGLCITRTYPPMVRSKYGLEKTPIVWLTGEACDGERTVNSIQDLSIVIGDFLEKAKKPVLLLDGFEYLVTKSGFDSFLRFLQVLKDRIQRAGGLLIAPILVDAFSAKELAHLERETATISVSNA